MLARLRLGTTGSVCDRLLGKGAARFRTVAYIKITAMSYDSNRGSD